MKKCSSMFNCNNRCSLLFKATAIALVCLFLVNDLSWAIPQSYNAPAQATLAIQSRFKPFFEKHELGFQNMTAVIYASGRLKELLIDKHVLDDITLNREIIRLNRLFPDGSVKIREGIQDGRLKGPDGKDGKAYKYAVFDFVKEKETRTINVLFLADHTNLTPDELRQLRVIKKDKKGHTIIDERYHLDCPGLEGVWFMNCAPVLAEEPQKPASGTMENIEELKGLWSKKPLFLDLEKEGYAQVGTVGPFNYPVYQKAGHKVLVKYGKYLSVQESDGANGVREIEDLAWFEPFIERLAYEVAEKAGIETSPVWFVKTANGRIRFHSPFQ